MNLKQLCISISIIGMYMLYPSVNLKQLCISISSIGLYMMYPSVNLTQLCISIFAIRNNLTNKIENVLTIKASVKEQFLFNMYIV